MRRLDQSVEARTGHVDLDRLLGDVAHQGLKSLEAGQVGGAHLDTAHHGHRVRVRATVVGHRDGGKGHIDVDRAKAVGVDEPKDRRDHVRSRGAGGKQRLADPHGKVDNRPGRALVHPVCALPQGDHVIGCATVPYRAPARSGNDLPATRVRGGRGKRLI